MSPFPTEVQRLASRREGWDNSKRVSWKRGHLNWVIGAGGWDLSGQRWGGRSGETRDTRSL